MRSEYGVLLLQKTHREESTGLLETSNTTLKKRARGRSVDNTCSSVLFPVGEAKYTQVCGIVQASQSLQDNLANICGLMLPDTGKPKESRAPATTTQTWSHMYQSLLGSTTTARVGSQYKPSSRTAWDDPLWDGAGCTVTGNQCCERYGWFHRVIPPTTDDIEIRWCSNLPRSQKDVYTDLVEIWVL